MRSHLHGFVGFVFGILLLAAGPIYIATTAVVIKTKKPLFTIPIPEFVRRAFAPPPPPAPDTSTDAPASTPTPADTGTYAFKPEIPREIHGAFIRARSGISARNISAFDISRSVPAGTPTAAAVPVTAPQNTNTDMADDFPLPTDFGDLNSTDDTTSDFPSFDSVPTFSEINFDAPANTPDAAPAPEPAQPSTPHPDTANVVVRHLIDNGKSPVVDGDIIVCDDMIIATHYDDDFWIADDTDWFASGKQRPSPIAILTARASDTGKTPVLYLGATNILDLDARIATWRDMGIRVITDLAELV